MFELFLLNLLMLRSRKTGSENSFVDIISISTEKHIKLKMSLFFIITSSKKRIESGGNFNKLQHEKIIKMADSGLMYEVNIFA